MVAATWIRPEWVPLEVLYGAWLIWRDPKFRTWPMLAMFAIGLALVPDRLVRAAVDRVR